MITVRQSRKVSVRGDMMCVLIHLGGAELHAVVDTDRCPDYIQW